MSQFEQEQRRAESLGMAGSREFSRELSNVGTSVALALYQKVMLNAQRLRDAKQADQEKVAEVGSRLASAPTSELATAQALSNNPTQGVEAKPLIDYLSSDQDKAKLMEQIQTTKAALEKITDSKDPKMASEASAKVIKIVQLINELGIPAYVDHSVRSTLENSKFFSDRELAKDEKALVNAETARPIASAQQQPKERTIDVAVGTSEPMADDEAVLQTEAIPQKPVEQALPPRMNLGGSDRRPPAGQSLSVLSGEQKKVIQLAGSIADGYEGRPAQTFDFEQLSQPVSDKPSPQRAEPAKSASQSSNEPSAEVFVSVYQAETFEIRRRGYVVSIFDATSDNKEPLFAFEQRGQRVRVLKDEITSNPDIYRKFERASNNLETMKQRGQGVDKIFTDKTHIAQVAVLGELAPRGSTAIATAHLLTSDVQKVRTVTTESGRQIRYERRTQVGENNEQPYDVITVSKNDVSPGDSIVAMSEDGSILSQSHPTDYAELRQNYDVAKEEHQLAQQAAQEVERQSKMPKLRDRGGSER